MKKNVVIILLILIVLGLGGYIAYDKLYAKEDDKKVETKDETSAAEEAKELTSDERYALYLKKLEENLLNNFGSLPEVSTASEASKYNGTYYSLETFVTTLEDVGKVIDYKVSLNNEKELIINANNNSKKIASNVLQYYVLEEGNAGMHYIYYINTQGKLYMVNYEMDLVDDKWNFETKEIKNAKNIINVIFASAEYIIGWDEEEDEAAIGGAGASIFIDIDGNMYTLSDNGSSLKQMN